MLIKEEGYIHDVIRRSNPKTMLCLKSYGRSNQYSMPSNLPQLKTVDPKIKLQALAVERNQKNRLYQSQARYVIDRFDETEGGHTHVVVVGLITIFYSYENGRFLDFLDVALGPPLSKDHCRENTFSKTFHESGTFTDTTLGAEERRRAKYEQGCVERHERRHERQLNLEHARKQLWIKKIERKHTREVRRLEQHRVNAAALHIQTVARGKNARTYVKNVREAHQRHESAVIIQVSQMLYRDI